MKKDIKIRINVMSDFKIKYKDVSERYYSPIPIKWYEWLFPFIPCKRRTYVIHPPIIEISIISPTQPLRIPIKNNIKVEFGKEITPQLVSYKTIMPEKKYILVKDYGHEELMTPRKIVLEMVIGFTVDIGMNLTMINFII